MYNKIFFQSPNLFQVMKEFFEGSYTMKADVKYKDSNMLGPKPLGIIVNWLMH